MEVQVQVQDQPERRPSWRKVPRLFSHTRLRVTPRSSSLDLQHSHSKHHQQSPTPSSLTLSVDAMSDFLERENELLGGSFSPSAPGANSSLPGDIDLDAAASAFPDISLDGSGDLPPIHTQSVQPAVTGNGLGFDAFDAAVSTKPPVKVTGDDEIEKFEDQFPDIGAGSPVRLLDVKSLGGFYLLILLKNMTAPSSTVCCAATAKLRRTSSFCSPPTALGFYVDTYSPAILAR